jgi:crotonobetaine/carnitine-CoA ligase
MVPILLAQPPRADDSDNPVRTVLSAGCPPWAWEPFEARFGIRIVEWFGMVDTPGFLVHADGRVGSMGKPVGDAAFALVDDDDRPVGPGIVGEVVMRQAAGQMSEYLNQPEATATAYRGGWFHTGDLAEADSDGFYYYRGRKKESIRRRGENISAWEIETVVNRHPAVSECAAHAVPSELGEDEVKLVVVPRPGAPVSPEELIAHCEGNVASYALPRYVELVDEIPKTATQRPRYAALRERGVTPATWDRTSGDEKPRPGAGRA